ncbi:glucose PTS transporter subunit IIA [[Acholeplasma] multilocale]|uniref:glucose PTS transporter subunit IIA n=1 Tax=[Acholeplasma] multilocale TaxID=264638 RepID=UPI00047970F8|nr:glucose PTS transporter subunit IIA [[Acholeplasma] multilocale]
MEKNRIIIYAPVSGSVYKIEDLNDGVFSEGMLGEGIYIEPTSKEYYSPLEKAKLSLVTDSKHAYYFEHENGPNILMHIGLDTVSMDGTPFKVSAKVGDDVDLTTKIVSADLQSIKDNGFAISTPILLDTNENSGWKFKPLNIGEKVKRGQPIGEFVLADVETEEVDIAKLTNEQFYNQQGRYETIAQEINKFVGLKNNYTKVYNCMTRLRFSIKDKEIVDVEKIKALPIVKGVVWNAEELQIIIGGEVYKVKDAVANLGIGGTVQTNKTKTPKQSTGKKLMAMMGGIMVPSLPILIAAGLLMGVQTIFKEVGMMPNIVFGDATPGSGDVALANAPVGWAILKVVAEVSLKFMGIFVGYNTAKYFGGNPIMGIAVSLMIASPFLFDGGRTVHGLVVDANGYPILDANGLPQWGNSGMLGIEFPVIHTGIDPNPITNPAWFGLGTIKVMPYTSSILAHIVANYLYVRFDKWIQKWMPTQVDIIFRHVIALAVIVFGTFFLLGPILYIVEQVVGGVVYTIGQIPGGIGVGVFAAMWQVAVLFGMHMALGMAVAMGMVTSGVNFFGAGSSISVWAQVGALIGVIIMTKNAQLKSAAIAALPGGIFGVTEPIIYGVNVPKGRPFIAGIIASFAGGVVAGVAGVSQRAFGGMGIFEITGFLAAPSSGTSAAIGAIDIIDPIQNTIWYVVSCVVGLFGGLGLSLLMYSERLTEPQLIKKANNLMIRLYAAKMNISKVEAKKILGGRLGEISKYVTKEDIKKIKVIEKEVADLRKIEKHFHYW